MEIYWTALGTIIAGIFGLAIKRWDGFERLRDRCTAICAAGFTFAAGVLVGRQTPHSDDIALYAAISVAAVMLATLVADVLLEPRRDRN